MTSFSLLHAAVAFAAAFAAGAINSVAGGGTLISFPTLIWLGLNSVTANATNTVAIWPGSLGGMWGFRRELRTAHSRLLALILPSLIGGLAGAWLLRYTPVSYTHLPCPGPLPRQFQQRFQMFAFDSRRRSRRFCARPLPHPHLQRRMRLTQSLQVHHLSLIHI